MTTKIQVTACVSGDKQVLVEFNDGQKVLLNDGDKYETYIYGDREIAVKEVPKNS